MKVEKVTYYNSLPLNSKITKSFYKNEESEDAITFSSELSQEGKNFNSNQNDSSNEENKAKTSEFNKNEEKKDTEKLNIVI